MSKLVSANNSQNIKQSGNSQQVSPEIIEKFIDIEDKKVALGFKELEARQQEDAKKFEYAKSLLEANIEDRKEQREHSYKKFRVIAVISALIIASLVVLVILGKDSFVINFLKIIGYPASIIFGFYTSSISKYWQNKKSEEE